jgi:hypothetical protein
MTVMQMTCCFIATQKPKFTGKGITDPLRDETGLGIIDPRMCYLWYVWLPRRGHIFWKASPNRAEACAGSC